ncbi:MAG: terminase small subunit [Casimicrobiaceae bacterium]
MRSTSGSFEPVRWPTLPLASPWRRSSTRRRCPWPRVESRIFRQQPCHFKCKLWPPRQHGFAEHYALTNRDAQAPVQTDYAAHLARVTASQLQTKANVRELIIQQEANAAREFGLTCEKMLEGLCDALEMSRLQNNPVAMVEALRESAKISDYYAPERTKVEISAEGQALQAKFAAMSDAGLLAIAEGRQDS